MSRSLQPFCFETQNAGLRGSTQRPPLAGQLPPRIDIRPTGFHMTGFPQGPCHIKNTTVILIHYGGGGGKEIRQHLNTTARSLKHLVFAGPCMSPRVIKIDWLHTVDKGVGAWFLGEMVFGGLGSALLWRQSDPEAGEALGPCSAFLCRLWCGRSSESVEPEHDQKPFELTGRGRSPRPHTFCSP